MARNLPQGLIDHLQANPQRWIVLVKLSFDGGDLNLWSGYGRLDWDGVTYNGSGRLLTITPAQETANLQANGMTFTLAGVYPSIVASALAQHYQGRPAKCWLGALDSDGGLIGAVPIFVGRMDSMPIKDDGREPTIKLQAENRLIALKRPNVTRYTDAEQKRRFPLDDGLKQVASLNDGQKITWVSG